MLPPELLGEHLERRRNHPAQQGPQLLRRPELRLAQHQAHPRLGVAEQQVGDQPRKPTVLVGDPAGGEDRSGQPGELLADRRSGARDPGRRGLSTRSKADRVETMREYEGQGKLVAFTIASFIAVVVLLVLGVPWWLAALVVFAGGLVVAWILRRAESGRWSYGRQRYSGELEGRSVEVIFDERLVVLNRLSLLVDGGEADRDTIFYGTKTLRSDSGETPLAVEVGSGWVGTCTGAIARSGEREQRLSHAGTAAG